MTNQELFERAVAGNWIAESFDRPNVSDGVGKFYLQGSSKGYTNFSDTIDDGSVVFYAAFDDDCNREAGFATFNAADQSLTPIESTATLQNDKYVDGDVAPVPFPNGGTITGTFNAVAFNAIWAHIWDKDNPHEVDAGQVEQDNDNLLGDNVQDALDNLSGIIAEWDNAIKSTAQNYVQELPPPNPQKGDMWTDVGVTGEQYVWEGAYWVSVTGGGLGVDLDDLDSYSSKITTDVVDDDQLYDIPLERVISSATGEGKWVAGGDGSGAVFVPEAPLDGLQYGRENGEWTEVDAGGVWDSDGIEDVDGNAIGHYYHLTNSENTNIFKTTIGSDEVEMMGLTSISASGYLDQDGQPILTGYATETYVDGKVADMIDSTKKNDVVEGTFQIVWDDSADENYPFNGRIGYNKNSADPNSLDGSFMYVSGNRGTFSIGRDGDVELHGASEIQGIPDGITGDMPWISGFQSVQALQIIADSVQAVEFVDANGNSIIQPAGVTSVNAMTGNVTLDYSDVGAKPNSYKAPVDSVNGKTGAVALTAADVGALDSSYQPPAPETAQGLDRNGVGATVVGVSGFQGNFTNFMPTKNGTYSMFGCIGQPTTQWSVVYSASFYKDGSPMIAGVDLIDTFSTIKSAITEETTVEGLRTAVVSGLDQVLAKLHALEDKAVEEGHKI